ncbi:hypothetical protein C0J52_02923 [Blattella germanica]|nr:hypothetical protein C0J52_02923 [Blattella germanica]
MAAFQFSFCEAAALKVLPSVAAITFDRCFIISYDFVADVALVGSCVPVAFRRHICVLLLFTSSLTFMLSDLTTNKL